ncbi:MULTISPECIES: hypothetical protein [unclassified Mesorhizobium]|uniref:hypothetical protein n=1 Tax=unclassified Mesorhizobium TaxID=325217 RepID=UPI0011279676|nr:MULTISPECIES: hypothetical protein [unclassified Mesorhizobium]MCA0034086.1 hypothetical protein [Mesorhizobium sp. B263B2A]TPN48213.1 hypothetical protein FJ978_21630 [Mesorhizobium sp. B1-1-7]TPN52616.1 hypothetical protein FJ976_12640 [Mesorhizobium sp. B1-1-9]
MKSEAYDYHEPKNLAAEYAALQTPDDVLKEEMTIGAKRALLAYWASDVHAVPGRPALRQLENGVIVKVGDILRALNQLDEIEGKPPVSRARESGGRSSDRRRDKARRSWLRYPWRDDDDDPPPVPAYVAVPPRRGDGGVFAAPEHAAA